MIRLIRTAWRDLRCLITGTCPVFTEDAFTRWADAQRAAAEEARSNPIADDIYGPPPPARSHRRAR